MNFKYKAFLSLFLVVCMLFKQTIQFDRAALGKKLEKDNPFKDYDIKNGYIEIDNNKYMHYLYVKSKMTGFNIPVVIAEVGGPGLSTISLIMHGLGVFTSDFSENSNVDEIYENVYSVTNFADLQLIETPLNTGCSYWKNHKVKSVDEIVQNKIKFFEAFEDIVSIKHKDIYLYPISYAGVTQGTLGLRLLDLGYNIKGVFADSVYTNSHSNMKTYLANLWDHGSINWIKYYYYDFIGLQTSMGQNLDIYGSKGLFAYLEEAPIKGLDGKYIISPIDVRKKLKDWALNYFASEQNYLEKEEIYKDPKILGCNSDSKYLVDGIDPYGLKIQINEARNSYNKVFGEFLDKKIPQIIIEGKYDFPLGTEYQLDWIGEVEQFRNIGFNNKVPWETWEYGRKKEIPGKFIYLEVSNAGHAVWVTNSKVAYKTFRGFVENGLKTNE